MHILKKTPEVMSGKISEVIPNFNKSSFNVLLLEVNLDGLGAMEEETTLERSAPGDINYHGDGGDFTRMMLRMLMIGRDVKQ